MLTDVELSVKKKLHNYTEPYSYNQNAFESIRRKKTQNFSALIPPPLLLIFFAQKTAFL
jgi:hypothetical protein